MTFPPFNTLPPPILSILIPWAHVSCVSGYTRYEVNEAFAPVPLSWCKALGGDLQKLNVNGGAMAIGHPLGGTGCKLMVTLVHELERTGGRFGLEAICEGGGTANCTIIENMSAPSAKM
jgi:acetyl-CoA acetyltransferase